MKRFKTLFIMAAACVVSAVAQVSVPEPVLGVSFNAEGIVLSGTDAANHTWGTGGSGIDYTYIFQDPNTGKYIGATNCRKTNSAKTTEAGGGYYYVKYNSTDALGTTFANGGTWEILFRLDSKLAKNPTKSTTDGKTTYDATNTGISKIFASSQSGGWDLLYYVGDRARSVYPGGLKFEYYSGGNWIQSQPGEAKANLNLCEYTHVIVTVDKSAKIIKMYINGANVDEKSSDLLAGEHTFPNIGNPRRTTDMWFCLGADPAASNAPAKTATECENRTAFVFANIYNTVLTPEQVTERYNDETVRYYTHITPTTTSDLLWDVQPKSGNTVTDESPFHKIGIHGTLTTSYNSDLKRYEVVNASANKNNFAYRVYNYDTNILQSLNNGMAIEVYCKSNSATPASTISPLSFQQDGCIGTEFQQTGVVKFNYNNYGFGTAVDAAKGLNLSCGTAASTLTTNYTHYVFTCDRDNNISKIYKDGIEAKSYSVPQGSYSDAEENIIYVDEDMTRQALILPNAPCQWFCFNGDTNGTEQTSCDYPFDGNIVFGRVWGKYLTADDVTALSEQAVATSLDVTVGANKVTTAIFPFAAVVPAGATAYVVDVIKGSEANMVPYAVEGDVIPYGTPVIIKGDASTYTFNAADLDDAAVVAKIKTAPAKNLLVGSFATKKAQADQLYKISTSAAEFDKAAADVVLDAQQAWLPFETGGEDVLTLTENIVLTEAGGAALRAGYPEGYIATGKFSRTFKNAVSSTVCLPYAISSVSGGTLYSFDNITESEGEYTVHMSVASLPTTANTPYLFMPSADGEVTFSGTMTVPASMAAGNTTSGDWAFEGTYEKTTWSGLPAGSSAVYGYAAKAQNTINPGDFVKLKMTGEAYTPAFRAVMKYTGGASARSLKGTVPTLPSRLKVVLTDGNGNVTEIGSLEILQEQETWFTIDGKELQAKPTKRGIYIRNGKKVFVK